MKNANCLLIMVMEPVGNFHQRHLMSWRHWLLKTLRAGHESVHSVPTSAPREKPGYHNGLTQRPEMTARFHDYNKGAAFEGHGGLARLLSRLGSGRGYSEIFQSS
jgi:hypothetical protein